jgi:hypothetical protein
MEDEMSLKRTMKEATTLEPGTYTVRLMDLVETTLENPQFGNGDVIRFALETTDVVDEEGNPVQLDGIANDKLTPMSKLSRWLTAFGVSAKPGEDVDMEKAIGQQAMAVIVLKPGKDGTGAFPRIDDLVPLPKAGGRSVPTTPASVDISGWWKTTRDAGLKRDDVLKASKEMFGAEPAELAPEDRDELLTVLTGQ